MTNHTFYMGCKNIRGNTKNCTCKVNNNKKGQATDTFLIEKNYIIDTCTVLV